jgi:hypothetical protein
VVASIIDIEGDREGNERLSFTSGIVAIGAARATAEKLVSAPTCRAAYQCGCPAEGVMADLGSELNAIRESLGITQEEEAAALRDAEAGNPAIETAARTTTRELTREQKIANWASQVVQLSRENSAAHSHRLYEEPLWLIQVVLCWIAFRNSSRLEDNPEKSASSIKNARAYSELMVESKPERALLLALLNAELEAYDENGAELPPEAWAGTEVLPGRLHPSRFNVSMRKREVIACWPPTTALAAEHQNTGDQGASSQLTKDDPKTTRRIRGRPPGDEEKRMGEIKTILDAGIQEHKGAPKATGRAIAKELLKTHPSLNDDAHFLGTRFGFSAVYQILRGTLPNMGDLAKRAPFRKRT